jgi:hypothetical protein
MSEDEKATGALSRWASQNELTTDDAAIAALVGSSNSASTGAGDVSYLSYSGKRMRWSLGRDKSSPDPEATYIVEPMSFVEGWTCWKASQVAEKHEWSIYKRAVDAISPGDLVDHGPYAGDGDGWQQMFGFSLFDTDDPETEIKFTTTSVSGRNSASDLAAEIAQQKIAAQASGAPAEDIAVIALADAEFEAHGKKNGKPSFEVQGWVSRAEVERYLADPDATVDALLDGAFAEAAEAPPSDEDTTPKTRKRRRVAA